MAALFCARKPTNLSHDLVVLQDAPRDGHRVVVPIRPGHVGVDIGVDARHCDWLRKTSCDIGALCRALRTRGKATQARASDSEVAEDLSRVVRQVESISWEYGERCGEGGMVKDKGGSKLWHFQPTSANDARPRHLFSTRVTTQLLLFDTRHQPAVRSD